MPGHNYTYDIGSDHLTTRILALAVAKLPRYHKIPQPHTDFDIETEQRDGWAYDYLRR